MNSPRRPALAGPMPTGHHHHHHMASGGGSLQSSRKQSSSSGSSPVGSTRSVVFEDQDPLLPHNHKQRTSRPTKKQPLPNQRKNCLHYWPSFFFLLLFFFDYCTILSVFGCLLFLCNDCTFLMFSAKSEKLVSSTLFFTHSCSYSIHKLFVGKALIDNCISSLLLFYYTCF